MVEYVLKRVHSAMVMYCMTGVLSENFNIEKMLKKKQTSL